MTLHVYRNDVIDSFVAASPEDAVALSVAYYASMGSEYDGGVFVLVPDDKVMTIQQYNDDGSSEAKTAAEWCVVNGPGMLCSTEF